MKKFLTVNGVVVLLLLILIFSSPFATRLVKTGYLILQVSPYEQMVFGAETILILGDSTGYGTGASRPEDSVAGRIGADYPELSIQNNSRNGRSVRELVSVTNELYGQYALVLIQIGGNDIIRNRDQNQVERELRNIITNLENHTDHIVMMSTGNVGGAAAFTTEESARYEALTREFREMYLRVAAETSLTYIDLFVEPEVDQFVADPDTYLAIDGLHPSSAGYAVWYEELRPVLIEKFLE